MKAFLLAFLFFTAIFAQTDPIYEADFTKFTDEFALFQEKTIATPKYKITEDTNGAILDFYGEANSATTYGGVIMKNYKTSASGNFYITVEYKGESSNRAGGYIGYERSDKKNIYNTIGLDNDLLMDLYEIFKFKAADEWKTYKAYLTLPAGTGIRIILEKGKYFGASVDLLSAKFRNLKIYDYSLCDNKNPTCPETDPTKKQMQLGYYAFLFDNMDMKYKIFGSVTLDDNNGQSSKATLKFQYPHLFACCHNTAFYLFDKNGAVTNKNQFTSEIYTDLMSATPDQYDIFTYQYTMDDLVAMNCASEDATVNGKNVIKYTCNVEAHYYYDQGKTFSTESAKYEWTKENSQAIIKSAFYVHVYKETKVVFNSYIKTLEVNAICNGKCILDMELKLALEVSSNKNGPWSLVKPNEKATVYWTKYNYFKITSTPADYILDLSSVIINGNKMEQIFIDSFIQGKDKSVKGQVTFGMMMSGESGLELGKDFDLQFLTLATTSRRLLVESLPNGQVTGSQQFEIKEFASKLCIFALLGLALLLIF